MDFIISFKYIYYWQYELTKNINEGLGRFFSIVIRDKKSGKWPWRAPTKQRRLDVIIWQLKLPRADVATNNGIINAAAPIILSANV